MRELLFVICLMFAVISNAQVCVPGIYLWLAVGLIHLLVSGSGNSTNKASVVYYVEKSTANGSPFYTVSNGGVRPMYAGSSQVEAIRTLGKVHASTSKNSVYLQMEGFNSSEKAAFEASSATTMKNANRDIYVGSFTKNEFLEKNEFFSLGAMSDIRKSELTQKVLNGQTFYSKYTSFLKTQRTLFVRATSRSAKKVTGFIDRFCGKATTRSNSIADMVAEARSEMLSQYGNNDALYVEFLNELGNSMVVKITPDGKVYVMKNDLPVC